MTELVFLRTHCHIGFLQNPVDFIYSAVEAAYNKPQGLE